MPKIEDAIVILSQMEAEFRDYISTCDFKELCTPNLVERWCKAHKYPYTMQTMICLTAVFINNYMEAINNAFGGKPNENK